LEERTYPATPISYKWGNGPVLSSIAVFNLYWSTTVPSQAELDNFTASIVGSSYITTLYEYVEVAPKIALLEF